MEATAAGQKELVVFPGIVCVLLRYRASSANVCHFLVLSTMIVQGHFGLELSEHVHPAPDLFQFISSLECLPSPATHRLWEIGSFISETST